jgi:hypothetical protein
VFLMAGLYELSREVGVSCYNMYTKFHKNWFRISKCNNKGDTRRHTQTGNCFHKPTFIFFKSRKVR